MLAWETEGSKESGKRERLLIFRGVLIGQPRDLIWADRLTGPTHESLTADSLIMNNQQL
jgi:hypothetical protein